MEQQTAKDAPRRRKKTGFHLTGISFRNEHWEYLKDIEEKTGLCPSVTLRVLIERARLANFTPTS